MTFAALAAEAKRSPRATLAAVVCALAVGALLGKGIVLLRTDVEGDSLGGGEGVGHSFPRHGWRGSHRSSDVVPQGTGDAAEPGVPAPADTWADPAADLRDHNGRPCIGGRLVRGPLGVKHCFIDLPVS